MMTLDIVVARHHRRGMNRGVQLLTAALRERGLSQRACAVLTGEDQGGIARILSGQRLPSRRAALAFLREFTVPIESWDEPAVAAEPPPPEAA